jgi:hypothetical protein
MLYEREPWSQERKDRMAAIHRRRWGAPEGHCTIYGVHVPLEHADPIRFWAQWLSCQMGRATAREFVEGLKAEAYASVDRIRFLWQQRLEVGHNRELIRQIEWEAWHADKDRR